MPQAPEYLREMFDDDRAAQNVIEANYTVSRGRIISPKVAGHVATRQENHPIDYLWLEWDCGYEETATPRRVAGDEG
jgi:hypothetical protein